jgi:hypothetical protein
MPAAAPPAIIIHSLAQAMAAAAAADAVGSVLVLRSAEGAGATLGAGYFASIGAILAERWPGLPVTLVLDCADEAGTALGAFRRGLKAVRFTGPLEVEVKLAAIAAAQGGTLDRDRRPALDLLNMAEPEAACRRWLDDHLAAAKHDIASAGSVV